VLENRRAKGLACHSQKITVFATVRNTKNLHFTKNCFCFVRSMVRALINCTEFLKRSTNALAFMNVILLRNNLRHVPATYGRPQGTENKNTVTINVSKSIHI
jgi:hypothetical protein